MNFGNAASGLATALSTAAAGNQQGIAAGNQENTGNLLDTVKLYQQKAAQQLATQKAQSEMALQGAQKSEADARAAAIAAPPPKGSITLGPGQNAYGPDGSTLVQGPAAREDPSVVRERIAAAGVAAHDTAQQNALTATAANQDRQAKAREYTDALGGYQQVEAKNPALTSPLTTKLLGGFTGSRDAFAENETQAKARLKSAWQAYKDSGGNPPDLPSAGLVSDPYAVTPKAKP